MHFDRLENQPRASGARAKVLLVDDDPLVLRVTKRRLERQGYEVVARGSGSLALQCLLVESFDVVVSDLHMPEMDGLRLLSLMRERGLELPVVLLTGNPQVAAALEYGASQCLMKPAGDELLEAIDRAFKSTRSTREYVEGHGSGVFPILDRARRDG